MSPTPDAADESQGSRQVSPHELASHLVVACTAKLVTHASDLHSILFCLRRLSVSSDTSSQVLHHVRSLELVPQLAVVVPGANS